MRDKETLPRSLEMVPLRDDEVLQQVRSRKDGKEGIQIESLKLSNGLDGGEEGKED